MNWVQFWIHLALAVLGTAYFLYSYLKEKKIYQLLFVIWIPLTLLTYVCKQQWQILVLGGVQLVFFILVIYFLFRNPGGKKNAMQDTLDKLDSFGAEPTAAQKSDAVSQPDSTEKAAAPQPDAAAADEADPSDAADTDSEKEN